MEAFKYLFVLFLIIAMFNAASAAPLGDVGDVSSPEPIEGDAPSFQKRMVCKIMCPMKVKRYVSSYCRCPTYPSPVYE
ncbi:6548_t:CDS:2 [Acaulospora morrowiae]|uniref:6548_t:CDS:1 n=1 Tax=Acaulospora morrowiae TaxID=94023 RepID=A0A9N9D2G8_9GLOM|nr:6548_t:CDS:2 [Acaulospora morrowiae]